MDGLHKQLRRVYNESMPEIPTPSSAFSTEAGVFATTHWTVVLAAADQASPRAAEALEKLSRTYWYPLYAFVRRKGHDEIRSMLAAL